MQTISINEARKLKNNQVVVVAEKQQGGTFNHSGRVVTVQQDVMILDGWDAAKQQPESITLVLNGGIKRGSNPCSLRPATLKEEGSMKKLIAAAKKNVDTNGRPRARRSSGPRKPQDMFGGGRIKVGDVLKVKAFGKAVVAKVNKASISYTIDGNKSKSCGSLSELVTTEFPRSKYNHHHSGWSLFGLSPSHLARKASAAKKKADAPKPKVKAKATTPKKKAAKKATTRKRSARKAG